MKSERTKNCKRLYIILVIIHMLCLFGPILYFVPYGFATGEPKQKIGLGFTVIVSLCLAVLAIISDAKTRSGLAKTIMWILIIGILFCLTKVKTFIYIMAVVSILDEMLIVRLKTRYKNLYLTNKEIDRRN